MASVSKIFKPRRGLASTMAGSGKKDIVLQKGEFFLEAPSSGMGTGASKVKVGDGTTAYSSLPYALGDISNDKIDFSSNTSTTVANALTSVTSGNALKTIIGGLKQAISLCNTSITKLNDDIENNGGIGMTTEQANQLKSIYERVEKLSPTVTKIVIPYSHQGLLHKGQAGDAGACTGSGNITIILHGAQVISATVNGGAADGSGSGGWGSGQTSFGVSAASVNASTIKITTE